VDMRHIAMRNLAGITVPDTPVLASAIEYAQENCEPYLFNHVVRSWLFAARIGQLRNVEHDAEVVALGTLLHDITLNERFAGPRRFEVEGADLAQTFARQAGVDGPSSSVDLEQRCAQLYCIDRTVQGGGGGPMYFRRHSRCHRLAVRAHSF
jgi:hypothetical protein